MARPGIAHQPALDGLRALAVAVVLLFHADVPGFGGGYLGVSVFFTLSGFLITSLLIAEQRSTGTVGVGAFYVRRAKRLLPASLACIGLIALAALATDWFDAVTTLRRDLLGATLQVANWVSLAGGGSYQELLARSAGQASPVEHYWSLAIEEQFYWLWPLMFVALCRVARKARGQLVTVSVVTACFAAAAPLIAWVWGADAAYWATPARAAEILVGALCAFLCAFLRPSPVAASPLPDWVRWLAPVGLAALTAAVVMFPAAGGPAFSGGLPLVGVASAAVVVGLQVPGAAAVALSHPVLVWLGRISYGVYLFHWPIFLILDEPRVHLAAAPLLALRIAATVALAQVSFMLVERPIRTGLSWRPAMVGTTALAGSAAVALGVAVAIPGPTSEYWRVVGDAAAAAAIQPTGVGTLAPLIAADPESTTPATPAAAVPTAATPVDTSPPGTADTDHTVAPPSTETPLPTLERPVRVLVAGDSTAEATGYGLAVWAIEQPQLAQVSIDTEKGCGFVRDGERLVQAWEPVPVRCNEWLDQRLLATVRSLQPDVVMLLTTSWDVLDRRWSADGALTPLDREFTDRIDTDFASITTALLDAGAGHVVWVREPVPNVFWWDSGQTQEDPRRHAVLYDSMDRLASKSDGRVSVVNLPRWLSDSGFDIDHEARPDGVHWSPDASAAIAREFLGERLVRAALTPTPTE